MTLKIVSWNINGLSTIVHYHPWNASPTPFKDLLESLNADIICFQEHKLQRKDITFSIANVPGFDAYFSFSKVKKGYSGVCIYVRHNIICTKAEEGLTGELKSPSGTPYIKFPPSESIGGYPTSLTTAEALDLDSEGRTVIIETAHFVFISVYCPAVTITGRETFRARFLTVLEERVRNLVGSGKSVIVAGDINVCRETIDTADPVGAARRTESGVFEDTPSRKWLARLLNEKTGLLIDTGRHFHPDREGMYTCWEQRIQARAGNYGSRIDYVLASKDLLPLLSGADISADIIGSDHCPVWATFNIPSDPADPASPAEPRPLPPRLCARYFADAVPTQSIKNLFGNIPGHIVLRSPTSSSKSPTAPRIEKGPKRPLSTGPKITNQKKLKTSSTTKTVTKEGSSRRSVSDFFKSTVSPKATETSPSTTPSEQSDSVSIPPEDNVPAISESELEGWEPTPRPDSQPSKNHWTTIFTKKGPPLCDTHNLPCIELVTKKPGPNLGRRFWICSKPVGPGYDNGKRQKWEINPEYRCNYFKFAPFERG